MPLFLRNCDGFTDEDIVSIMLLYIKVAASFHPLQCYFELICLLWDKKNHVPLICSLFLSHVDDLLCWLFIHVFALLMNLIN